MTRWMFVLRSLAPPDAARLRAQADEIAASAWCQRCVLDERLVRPDLRRDDTTISAIVSVYPRPGSDPAAALAMLGDRPVDGYAVEEALLIDRMAQPSNGAMSGIWRVGTHRRRAGTSHEQFVRHWRERHFVLVERHHIGLVRYVQNVVTGRLTPATPELDGLFEAYFPTEDDFRERLYDDAAGERLLTRDNESFVDQRSMERFFLRRTVLVGAHAG